MSPLPRSTLSADSCTPLSPTASRTCPPGLWPTCDDNLSNFLTEPELATTPGSPVTENLSNLGMVLMGIKLCFRLCYIYSNILLGNQ